MPRGRSSAQYTPSEEEAPEDCIPLQLQHLFARLQLTSARSLSTHALTASFGWTSAESFQQHDVQELMRVLLDALEQAMTDSGEKHRFNELYEGEMKDYVRCLTCGQENSRVDKFQDVSLVIRVRGCW